MREPAAIRVVASGEVGEDGLGVAQGDLVVLQHRKLAQGVQPQELRGLVPASGMEVDGDEFVFEGKEFKQQADLVATAGQRVIMQADHASGRLVCSANQH